MVELDIISTIAAVIGITAAGMGAAYGYGKLVEKVKNLEKRVDKLESHSDNDKISDSK